MSATPSAVSDPYADRREELAAFFEEGAERWNRITSEEDVDLGLIRRTVRSGRRRMRRLLADWLPADLRGRRVLDAGCGTGVMAVTLAERGARVVAVDVAPSMIRHARRRTPPSLAGRIDYRSADFLDEGLGRFDHVVAMDSLTHYGEDELLAALARLGERTRRSLVFTFAPRTPLLGTMHAVGRMLPRSRKAPSVRPVPAARLRDGALRATSFVAGREERVRAGFYISHGLELQRNGGDGSSGRGRTR